MWFDASINDPQSSMYVSWSNIVDAGATLIVSCKLALEKRHKKRTWWVDPQVVVELEIEFITIWGVPIKSTKPNIIDQDNKCMCSKSWVSLKKGNNSILRSHSKLKIRIWIGSQTQSQESKDDRIKGFYLCHRLPWSSTSVNILKND